MNESLIELAKRAIACKHWRWMPGMLGWRVTHQNEIVSIRFVNGINNYIELADPSEISNEASPLIGSGHSVSDGWHKTSDILPDLSDPATLGCLIVLVRQAWKSSVAQLSPSLPDAHLWTCYINDDDDHLFREVTEAEALVVALEGAP